MKYLQFLLLTRKKNKDKGAATLAGNQFSGDPEVVRKLLTSRLDLAPGADVHRLQTRLAALEGLVSQWEPRVAEAGERQRMLAMEAQVAAQNSDIQRLQLALCLTQ